MINGDNAAFIKRQSDYEVLVIGGGICGCWLAVKAGEMGLKTCLIEKDEIGAGASGGLLGALMPHMPERWDGKKQFQFEALHDLPNEIKALEGATDLSAGYLRCGRVAPIMNETKRGQMLDHAKNVDEFWLGRYDWKVLEQTPLENWPVPDKATYGVVYDTLTARVNPRALMSVLKARIKQLDCVTLKEQATLLHFDAQKGTAEISSGQTISFSHLVMANGVETFGFISPLLNVSTIALGKPIKGQAASIKADIDPEAPILFDNGIYILSHDNGRVAIGSTSEVEFDDPYTTDEKLDDLLIKAGELCPQLKNAPVLERWAGVRPRAIGRDPLVDQIPDFENILVSTSGFKISFGVAHKMADVVLEHILGRVHTNVPESFRIKSHLAKARRAEAHNAI